MSKGIDMVTALEIYTNPRDLAFSIGKKNDKYAVRISRGPGHNYKLLLDSPCTIDKREYAVDLIKNALELINSVISKKFDNKNDLVTQIVVGKKTIDQTRVLNPTAINWIVSGLKHKNGVETCRMPK